MTPGHRLTLSYLPHFRSHPSVQDVNQSCLWGWDGEGVNIKEEIGPQLYSLTNRICLVLNYYTGPISSI